MALTVGELAEISRDRTVGAQEIAELKAGGTFVQRTGLGLDEAGAKQLAEDVEHVVNTHFSGDVYQAMAFFKQHGSDPRFANQDFHTFARSEGLGRIIESLRGQAPAAAQAPEAGAEPSATAEAKGREGMKGIMALFNDQAFLKAFESGDILKMIQAFLSALTGKEVAMGNQPGAFDGVRTPDGTPVAADRTQIDPATGQPVAATPAETPEPGAPGVTTTQLAMAR